MQLAYRGTLLPFGECRVQISRRQITTQQGDTAGYTESWVIEGDKMAADQATLTAALLQLEALFSVDGGDLVLYQDDGITPSVHALFSANTTSGVRVISRPSYPQGDGAQYVYFRHYIVELEAMIYVPTAQNIYSFFTERLSFSGGGPRNVWVPILNGSPVAEQVYPATTFRATQEGRAVGTFSTVPKPAPLWPDYLVDYGDYSLESGRIVPGPRRARIDFETTWSYKFESDQQLSGFPHLPP